MHAKTVTTDLVRMDGSTYQLSDFNPVTGRRKSPILSDGGAFPRRQSGRAGRPGLSTDLQAYQTSDNPAFLTTAEDVANYFVSHSAANGIPPWDFDATGTPPVDTSAAAIAADGLVMLSTVAQTTALKMQYLTDAENILESLSSSYLDVDPTGESVLIDGYPGGANATNTALIYGDYYFTEVSLRLQNVLDGKPGWVLYSPVPEPSTWAMMLLGFAGLGFAGYRRARAGRALTSAVRSQRTQSPLRRVDRVRSSRA